MISSPDSMTGEGTAKNDGAASKSNIEMTANEDTDSDSSSSDDSSDSSSDDSSVDSTSHEIDSDRLYNSSNPLGSKYFSMSNSAEFDADESNDANTSRESDANLSDEDLTDEALLEFFSQKSAKSHRKPTEQTGHDHEGESSDEEVVIERVKKPRKHVDIFDLDEDDMADLELDEENVDKVETINLASPTISTNGMQHSPGFESDGPDLTPKRMSEDELKDDMIKDKTPFRITYNCEKKKNYQMDEILLDSSDDESNVAASRTTKSNATVSNCSDNDTGKQQEPYIHKSLSRDDKENETNPYQKNKADHQSATLSLASSNSKVSKANPDASLFQAKCSSEHPRSELQRFGIDHDHFKPPKYVQRPDPILHKLNESNRPVHRRRKVSVDQVFPSPLRNLFKCKFQEFNHLQSEMSNVIANSDDNVIVSSPTGSGKTALFEMAMCRLFASSLASGNRVVSNAKKIVYIAPNKALCEERQDDWSKRLAEIDPSIVCTTITGDANNAASSYGEIASSNLILTTPEKWDSITRRWTEYVVLLGSVKLVVLDEVHMIGEPERGACLEAVISRLKTIQRASVARKLSRSEIEVSSFNGANPEALASNLRFVAVSATLPNLDQLAGFIEAGEAYAFNDSYRPVPLHVHVQACGHIFNNNRYLFDKGLNQHVTSLLTRFSKGRPAIIFCHSKNDTEKLADELTKSYSNPSSLNTSVLNTFANKASSSALQRFIRCGIAYHHAGLELSDRKIVEEAFMTGSIKCLCATSTLAMGVNLPSHLVIVKGTSAYRGAANGGHVDIDVGTLLQMIGRAGRPGFDTSGTAVIMTDSGSKSRYENLSHGLKVVESSLLVGDKLTEALNSEIAQGVITNQCEAVDWISGTLLFRRIKSHPLYYGMDRKHNGLDDVCLFLTDKCIESINQLRKVGAIIVREDGSFSPSAASTIMSRNFLDLSTLRSITKLPHDAGTLQILHLLAKCSKLQSQVRRSEKKHLKEAHKNIKYKLDGPLSKVTIKTSEEKAFVLLQASIGNHPFSDFGLRQEMSSVIDGALRILTSIEEYSREGSRNGHVLTQSHLLRRSFFHGIWGDTDGVLKQIGGVTSDLAAKLKQKGISSFSDVVYGDPEDIARACNMSIAFGENLRAAAATILQCCLKVSCSTKKVEGGLHIVINIGRKELDATVNPQNNKDNVKYTLLVFTDRPEGLLMSRDDISEEIELSVRCPDKFGRVYVRLISNLIGLDEQISVDGNDRIEKSSFSLSPTVVKSNAKSKNSKVATQKPSESAKKRLFDHRDSVSNINDMRLHKRGKANVQRKIECIEIDSNTEDDRNSLPVAPSKSSTKKAVTPSPHPASKPSSQPQGNSTSTFDSTPSDYSCRISRSNPHSSHKASSSSKAPQNRYKWNHEKRGHKIAQQSAFHSPKDNPFTSYAYDPNGIENNLNVSASAGCHQQPESSILPIRSTFSENRPKNSTFRTPATRRKSSVCSNRTTGANLLKQKAMEMNHYHQSVMTHRREDREQMAIAPSMQIGHRRDGIEDPMQSDFFFPDQYVQHRSVASNDQSMRQSHLMRNRPGFARTDLPTYNSSQHFPGDDYTFIHSSFDEQMPSTDFFQAHGRHQFNSNPFTRDYALRACRFLSSADHSNGSGLQRFSRQSYYENDVHFQPPTHEHTIHHQDMHMHTQPHPEFHTTPQRDHQPIYYDNPYNGLNTVDGETELSRSSFSNFGGAQHQHKSSMFVRNPYVQSNHNRVSQQRELLFTAPQEPPKEIVLQSNDVVNVQDSTVDDASLAFEDAFL